MKLFSIATLVLSLLTVTANAFQSGLSRPSFLSTFAFDASATAKKKGHTFTLYQSSTTTSRTIEKIEQSVRRKRDVMTDTVKTVRSTLNSDVVRSTLAASAVQSYQALKNSTVRFNAVAVTSISKFWWSFPTFLCLVPVYTVTVLQTMPTTPTGWKLVNMDFVHGYASAIPIIAAFLASNISYFIAGSYLLRKSSANNDVPKQLGLWIMTAGSMSTLFHIVQAVGDYSVAEALCYFDHGIAGTAILYFLATCGRPSGRTCVLAAAGLAALSFPVAACPDIYTWLHSAWHVLSAAAAVVWVIDARKLQQQQPAVEAVELEVA